MADINNFRQLDFQESGEPADNDRVLIVEIDNDKVVGAKNYALAKLKGYISADALAYLEECRLINASVSEKEERVSNIASQSAELLESTRGETIESLEQTVTSTEPGGVNVFTITQKNGSQKSLQTRNGLRGPEGPQGPQGPAVPLVQTTGTSTTSAMSQNAVSEQLNQLKSDLINSMYPIGSIYLTVSTSATGSSSPAQWIGGTWERLPEGKALWTASSDAGNTIPAGLPNIIGSFSANHTNGSATPMDRFSGAFSASGYGGVFISVGDTVVDTNYGANFNANNGATTSGIYRDDCTTVQPPAYKVYAWKRIA